jgi:hypothetical protein
MGPSRLEDDTIPNQQRQANAMTENDSVSCFGKLSRAERKFQTNWKNRQAGKFSRRIPGECRQRGAGQSCPSYSGLMSISTICDC